MSPDELEQTIGIALQEVIDQKIVIRTLESNSLSPGRPNPTYRFDHVV